MTLEANGCFAEIDQECDDVVAEQVSALWARVVPARFTAAEERVLALGLVDGLASLEVPNRLDRMMILVFGRRPGGRMLADPRLEALRRAAVIARHRRHLPDAEAARLRGAGFGEAQVRAIETRFA